MKKFILFTMFLSFCYSGNLAYGQFINKEEASMIANHWIQMVIDKYGQWGDSETAIAQPMQEFKGNDRLIGYYCAVNPQGYIIVSLRKELAPVKAYSDIYTLDPSDDKGMTDLIITCMLRIIDTIESRRGNIETFDTVDLLRLTEIDYRQNWEFIQDYVPGMIQKNTNPTDNYQEGEILMTSIWHQRPPYNNDCPDLGCTTTSNGRAKVGCVATAGAQNMKYWSWPPYGVGTGYSDTYDWPNMPDNATTSSSAAQQAAVAELNHEVGVAVDMDYGCDVSGAQVNCPWWNLLCDSDHDLESILKSVFRFDPALTVDFRDDYTASDWFELLKGQINVNCPLQYVIPEHAIVCDGWQEIGSPVIRQYHMNYGWANGATTWYTLDALLGGNPEDEQILKNIVPVNALGSALSGTYVALSFPYRYFDQDAFGSSATFYSGQLLQILPYLTITGTGTSTYIKFYGASGLYSRIFTDGNQSEGIVIKGGGIRLRSGGSIKLQ